MASQLCCPDRVVKMLRVFETKGKISELQLIAGLVQCVDMTVHGVFTPVEVREDSSMIVLGAGTDCRLE